MSAQHLIVLHIDFENQRGSAIYNGPLQLVKERLTLGDWEQYKIVNPQRLKDLDREVSDHDRLPILENGLMKSSAI